MKPVFERNPNFSNRFGDFSCRDGKDEVHKEWKGGNDFRSDEEFRLRE